MSAGDDVWEWLKEQRRQALREQGKCVECSGRGWHVGECHPQEECGACDGTGRTPTDKGSGPAQEALQTVSGSTTSGGSKT